jgi:hypothetical protein
MKSIHYLPMKSISYHNRSGSTLAVVICIMATLMVIAGVAAEFTMNVNRNAQRNNTLESAIAVGDSCIDVLFNSWRTTCRTAPTTPLATSSFSAAPTPSPGQFPNLPTAANFVKRGASYNPSTDDASDYDSTYTISNYKVVAVNAEWMALASASATPEPMLGQLTAPISSVSPTTSATYNYIASADVTLPALGSNKTVVAKIRRVFQKQQMSPWNFAIFFVDPLEIHPGPLFTVTGWVHTNSNLYTAHNTLTFADKVTFGSDWFINFMPGDQQHLSDVPASPNYPAGLPPARDQTLQPFGIDSSSIFSTSDSNPNNDSYAELIQPPVAGYTDPLSTQRYWDQANVVIQIDASNNITIGRPNSDGTITNYNVPVSNPNYFTYHPLYAMFSSAISTNQTIQDNREGASIRLATLDVSQIETGASANPSYKAGNFNGIVYIYDSSNTSSTRRGIRIKNGSKIPTSGLTVVSNNPVYIQGDFNTGGTGSAVPSNNPSNFNSDGTYINPATPPLPDTELANNYQRAPTSILADAVTILSNSWSDANAGTVPAASPTTVNTAIVAGTVSTAPVGGDGSYSGGAENFPRFLEDWTNKTLSYYGSMVELYKSQQSIGEWGKGNVYVPPTREWFFDNNFQTKPPPGTLMLYTYIKGRWYVL